MTREKPCLYLIIPCFNEEEVLPKTCDLFLGKINELIKAGEIAQNSKILFVNDGSTDSTWEIIKALAARDPHFAGIAQSRNRGHQAAVLAGLMEAKDKCDITISIDCDGQQDINAVDTMIAKYKEGAEVVYGVRNSRGNEGFFKKATGETFYRVLGHLGADFIPNHADYRLVSNRVLRELANYGEVNLFLRGLFPLVGFKSEIVRYDQFDRVAGHSHYTLTKMLTLAWDGITSLSVRPLHFITILGMVVAILSFIAVVVTIVEYMLGMTVQGWASTTSIIAFIGGVQLVCVGVIGEYVGKIYLEVKHRPRYVISDRTGEDETRD